MNSPEKRIGIIGAGVAGMTAAWLLSERHRVTLLEKDDRLGGHANTVRVEVEGEEIWIDAGAEFFSEKAFPHFYRLLQILDAPLRAYPMTATLYSADHREVTMMPPVKDGRPVFSMLGRKQIDNLLRFRSVLKRARPLMEDGDMTTTIDEFLNSLGLPPSFRDRFIYPFLQSGWCLDLEDFKQFIAYDVLQFAYKHQPAGLKSVKWLEVVGGMQAYVRKLEAQLEKAEIRLGAEVTALQRVADSYHLHLASGEKLAFDEVVVATNARAAHRLLSGLPSTESMREALGQIDYFKTVIAVHDDPALMPADPRHWSVVNMRYDREHAHTTVYKSWRSKYPVFRSWITYEQRLPRRVFETLTYDHPKTNRQYFAAQEAIAREQGKQGLWMAGMHTHDVETHESAILSAIKVARLLAPESVRMEQLTGVQASKFNV